MQSSGRSLLCLARLACPRHPGTSLQTPPTLLRLHRDCATQASESRVKASVFNLVRHLEDITGITAVREAQLAAVKAEREFSRVQDKRRDMQQEIRQVQIRLKDIHSELDKTSRGEDRYLNLLTEEHGIIKKERLILDEFKNLELAERDKFNELSARLRESHEKERERAETTKYWSIIGTVIGALLGIAGSAISNRMRMRKFQELVETQTEPGRVNAVLTDLSSMVQAQQDAVRGFIGDLRGILAKEGQISADKPAGAADLSGQTEEALLAAIRDQSSAMAKEMTEVRRLIAVELGYASRSDGTIVYIGPEVSTLLAETESNLEWKMKIQTLCNVVLVYAALCITIPFLAGWFDK